MGNSAARGGVRNAAHRRVGAGHSVPTAAGLLLGNPKAAKQLWTLFASANQLLASLTLLTATIWLVRNRKPGWITAIPMVFMFGVSSWALTAILISAVKSGEMIRLFSSAFLLALAAALIVIAALKGRRAAAS